LSTGTRESRTLNRRCPGSGGDLCLLPRGTVSCGVGAAVAAAAPTGHAWDWPAGLLPMPGNTATRTAIRNAHSDWPAALRDLSAARGAEERDRRIHQPRCGRSGVEPFRRHVPLDIPWYPRAPARQPWEAVESVGSWGLDQWASRVCCEGRAI